MGALEPGGGAGAGAVAAVSPLARMWRTVYQKAAAVAEARAVELLKQHVYVYPHGAGGGAGGGWVLLDEIGPLAADTVSPLAFAGIPQDAVHLWLHFEGRATGSGLGTLGVQLNGDAGMTNYSWSMHYVAPSATHTQNDSYGDNAVRVVQQIVTAGEPAGALTTADVFVPHYAKDDARYQRIAATAQSDNLDASGNDFPEMSQTVGAWKSGAPVTAVRFYTFASGNTFAAGTHVQLYGLTTPGARMAATR
jgi:hypothetical protein